MPRTTRSWVVIAAATAVSLVAAACGGDADEGATETGGAAEGGGSGSINVLIGSSGDPETNAVNDATAAWAETSGTSVTVLPAQDLVQQLGQGFAGGSPPTAFYVPSDFFGGWAQQGSLYPYGDQIDDVEDFVPGLRDAFTWEDQLYCVPKDFSTLALVINTDLWEAAGLTADDVPTDWDGLRQVAEQLTGDGVTGLVFGPELARVGAFMLQAGGWVVNEDQTEAIADSPENLEALQYVKEMLEAGVAAYPGDVGAGWGGEAFGTQVAAMTIEGNWIKGALLNDYPDVNYQVAELPAGPAGKGTMQFTVCWGVASQSDADSQAAAVDMINTLTSPDGQLEFAEAFGVMPSRQSALDQYAETYPEDAAFAAGAEYGTVPPNIPGIAEAIAEFNSQLGQLKTGNPEQMLADLQTNTEAALGG